MSRQSIRFTLVNHAAKQSKPDQISSNALVEIFELTGFNRR